MFNAVSASVFTEKVNCDQMFNMIKINNKGIVTLTGAGKEGNI